MKTSLDYGMAVVSCMTYAQATQTPNGIAGRLPQ
jgi:hypothetical protein